MKKVSKILIEELFRKNINGVPPIEIEVYCFNGEPKIFVKARYYKKRQISVYDEKFNNIDLILHPDGNNTVVKEEAEEIIKQTFDLSKVLAKEFNFVRVDWMLYRNKIWFEELTFTPYSGLISFDKKWERRLGNWLKL